MKYPKITIVTISLNSEKYIKACIQSVLSQGYPNLEYIVIDGGSTDRTCSIIEEYKQQLSFFLHEPDNGAAEALNKGFAESSGEIMCWLNSDDKLHAGALFAVAEIFQTFEEVDWIMGYPTWYTQNGVCVSDMSYDHEKFYQSPGYINDSMHFLFARWSKWRFAMGDFNAIQQESVFWRRRLWEKAGAFVAENIIAYDLELWTRYFQITQLYTVNVILSGFRGHNEQLSVVQKERYKTESRFLIESFTGNIGGRRFKNRIRAKLARISRLFYYYRVPKLEKIFPSLMKLPPVIQYNIRAVKFELLK